MLLQFASNYLVEPIITLTEEKMNSNGVSAVLDYIRNPPIDAKRMSLFDEKTKKSLLKLKRDHLLISLTLFQLPGLSSAMPLELQFFPMHGKRGWNFERHGDEKRLIPLPIANEQFLEMLRTAFDVAS